MLLVSAFRYLGSKNLAKCSTQDGATGDYRKCYIVQGERATYFDRTDPTVGLFRNMLLVSASRHLGSKNVAKRSTQDGTVLSDSKNCDKGLQFVWKCHIIHSVLETQALLIFLKVIDEEN